MFQLIQVVIEHSAKGINRPFSYACKADVEIKKGERVYVNFGRQELIGFVVSNPQVIDLSLEEYSLKTGFTIKYINKVLDSEPVLNDELLSLAYKMTDYYCVPLIDVLKVMLPPSLRPNTSSLSKPKRSYESRYNVVREIQSNEILDRNEIKLLDKLKNSKNGLMKSEITSPIALEKLIHKGIVKLIDFEKLRLPSIEASELGLQELNEEQEKAYKTILTGDNKRYLIYGITGSGKTEVYLQLVNQKLKDGLDSIVLVPEISLTDRLVSRFKAAFGDQVALLHSGLTDTQKYDEYIRIARGDVHVVVGARSAVFAPLSKLGLIIIDEEHSQTYKQDNSPYYEARKVANMRLDYHPSCRLVLGSATPSIDVMARGLKGIYTVTKLIKRYSDVKLPEVQIVDLSDVNNLDYDNPIISKPLKEKLALTLEKKEQAILLLNRRGYAPIYVCRHCHKPIKCPSCDIPLTLHKSDMTLKCHHCNYEIRADYRLKCPNCGKSEFYTEGYGTERIVLDLQKLFPDARIIRFDADNTRQPKKYHQILSDFSNKKYDIMVGTQMVAKGHDFPSVSFACALLADQSLSFPSYKANEDTFDLLVQLIGRAGRKEQGYAMIQTYLIDNEVIQMARNQDYDKFYEYEIDNRRKRRQPPYYFLINFYVSASTAPNALKAANKIKNLFISSGKLADRSKCDFLGPSKPYLPVKNNRYYYSLMLKYKKREEFNEVLTQLRTLEFDTSDIKLNIDVDPSSDII